MRLTARGQSDFHPTMIATRALSISRQGLYSRLVIILNRTDLRSPLSKAPQDRKQSALPLLKFEHLASDLLLE
jgi:hypothetical protein